MQHFLSANDVTDIDALLALASAYKASPLRDAQLGVGKRIGLLFLNPSLRTRLSTQIAARNLGMEAIVINMDGEGWRLELEDGAIMNGSSVEHIRDAAPVLGSYFDLIGIRSFPSLQDRETDYQEALLHQLVKYAGVPILSLESATLHPLQSLADLLSIRENWQEARKPKVVLSWAPHPKALPQCVANSFAQWVNAWGEAELIITHPKGYELHESFCGTAQIEYDQQRALEGADFVYVKNWSAYHDYGAMPAVRDDWMLQPESLAGTNQAKVMHCLPVRRNVELSDAILDGPDCLTTTQATNRVWAAQAVLSQLIQTLKKST